MRAPIDLTLGIPTYNSGQFLDDALNSITRQTCAPRQIIFCDNGSTDDTVERILKFKKQNPDLNVSCSVNEANLGVAGNYNRLIEKSGDTRWFQILDSDDWFMDDYWSYIVSELGQSSDIDLIITGMRTTSAIVNVYLAAFDSALAALSLQSIPPFIQVLGGLSGRSSLIYRTALIKSEPFIDPFFDGSDIIHMNKFISHNIWRPRAKIRYRVHPNSTTSQLHRDKQRLRADHEKYLKFVNGLGRWKRTTYTADFFLRKRFGALIRRGA